MAPASTSKTLQQNRPSPTVPKAIVPAIPLPYIQKRKQQQAAREKASEEAVQAQETAFVAAPSSLSPPPTKVATSVVNGSSEDYATEMAANTEEPPETEVATGPVFVDENEVELIDTFASGAPTAPVEEETTGK